MNYLIIMQYIKIILYLRSFNNTLLIFQYITQASQELSRQKESASRFQQLLREENANLLAEIVCSIGIRVHINFLLFFILFLYARTYCTVYAVLYLYVQCLECYALILSFNQQSRWHIQKIETLKFNYKRINSAFLSLQSQEKEREQTHQALEQVERGRAELDARQALVEQIRADLAASAAKCEQLLTQIDTLTGEKLGKCS